MSDARYRLKGIVLTNLARPLTRFGNLRGYRTRLQCSYTAQKGGPRLGIYDFPRWDIQRATAYQGSSRLAVDTWASEARGTWPPVPSACDDGRMTDTGWRSSVLVEAHHASRLTLVGKVLRVFPLRHALILMKVFRDISDAYRVPHMTDGRRKSPDLPNSRGYLRPKRRSFTAHLIKRVQSPLTTFRGGSGFPINQPSASEIRGDPGVFEVRNQVPMW